MKFPVRPLPITAAVVGASLVLAAGAPRAEAGEGRLPVLAGDTVRGTLRRCLDRQVAEVELLKGEVFRFRVQSAANDNEAILLRVVAPDGFNASDVANVRLVGGQVVAGPFKATQSGTWSFEISTLTAHGAQYEARSDIRRTRGTTAKLGGRTRGVTVAAAAGATIRLRGRDVPALALRRPAQTVAEVLAPDSAPIAALLGAGLAAPRAGTYEFSEVTASKSRLRISVTPPARRAAEVVDFPTLPSDPYAVASWQTTAGWLVDPTQKAPDPQGNVPAPSPETPRTSPYSGSLADDCPGPGESAPPATLDDAGVFLGPSSGVGLPAAGIPRIEDVVARGQVEETSAGPVYVLTRASAALGAVTTRVRFVLDGRSTRAPLALDGRIALRWSDEGGSQHLTGAWSLAFDPVRGVQVLDGAESMSADGVRTLTTSAQGFALPEAPGAWPQGRIALGFSDTRIGADYTRTETFDGGAAVTVLVSHPGGTSSTTVHTFPGP